ncbi:hypothetical protein [Moritella sp. Urea-trap-13]|uniref:hypothetical protein n=1 Tax=Moritella sp. Urea-trap-13 TaxID=2058327 RepID=UPI000C33548F|nr:hypothetical protein [Moritella sp. Urea-trap-13]PKH05662.1 hypothetical protein CXF93_16575 [Moritella sp. Urea-trap-13]
MYKIIAIALFASSLAGCETSSQAYSMAQQGADAFTCPEISKAFTAYEADRQSASALTVIAPLISADIGTMTEGAVTTTDSYYAQAKSSANVALLLKGCSPIQ